MAGPYKSKRFNSPNDVVVKSDGSIWFSGPPYGILFDYEGKRSESEIGASCLCRIDPSGEVPIAADDFEKPDGLALSPDGKYLYVADTCITRKTGGPKHIHRFDVARGKLSNSVVFADCSAGLFEGFRVDAADRVWTSVADGVHCYDPDGTLIGKIKILELVSNVCFGGSALNRLFICGATSLYAVFLAVNGCSPSD